MALLESLVMLFYEFFKVGLFAIGGGLATLPFLNELQVRYDWFTPDDITNMLAISESTPGPLGVNMATYVGFKNCGVIGGVVATLGLIAPSIIIIIIIARFLRKFQDNPYVRYAFYGLRPASAGLIAAAALDIGKVVVFSGTVSFASASAFFGALDLKGILFGVLLLVLTNIKKLKKIHPVFFIAFAAVIGIVFRFGGV